MKKSQLRNIIRESIHELIIEQKENNCKDTYKLEDSTIKEQSAPAHVWTKCWALNHSNQSNNWGMGSTYKFTFGNYTWTPGPNSFYQWAVSQIGPINIGDSFVFDMLNSGFCTSPWGSQINKVCIKYAGIQVSAGFGWTGTTAQANTPGCCDMDQPDPCRHFYALPQNYQDACCTKCKSGISPNDPCAQHCDCCPDDPVEPNFTWDCVLKKSYEASIPDEYKCVAKTDGSGQYTNLQDCQDNCNEGPIDLQTHTPSPIQTP